MERQGTSSGNVERNYTPGEARRQNLIPPPPLMHFMKYVVPMVLALVAVKYQAKPDSLFVENTAPLWCFIAAICVYWLSVEAMKQTADVNGTWFQIASRAALASGVLSALSLLSMFLTYPVSLVPLLIWILIPVILAWPMFYHAYNLVNRGIEHVSSELRLFLGQ